MKNVNWLLENGGTSFKLRMLNEAMIDQNSFDIDELVNKLLHNDKIIKELTYFDVFKDISILTDNSRDCIHGCYDDCFEMYMHFMIRSGFYCGINVFDKKIDYIKNVYPKLIQRDVQKGGMPFWGIIIMKLLLLAGYYFDDMESYTLNRLNEVHKVTILNKFDFYEDIDKIRQPKKWSSFKILKDIYNPYEGEFPLPIIYDVELFLYIYKHLKNEPAKK